MKILIAHNDYGKYSGEEAVVDKMASLFQSQGHEVAQLRMSTAGCRDSLKGKMKVFAAGLRCPSGVKAMREALKREKPDVVNVHNLYPFISPAALRECRKAGVPVIMTVHNFRLICPTGLFMRDGQACELCLKRGNEWGCVKYNCENSRLKSVAYAARNALARRARHYLDCVDRFACITDFQRRKLIEAGYPEDRITVIPNSCEVTPQHSKLNTQRSTLNYVGFCGRISHEKGIDLILEAARRLPDINFCLAGAVGDEALVSDLPDNVTLLGHVSGQDLEDFYRNSRFIIMASRCYEGFPMAILEAARHGKPTIGPDHGGFTEIIGGNGRKAGGLLFTPGEADSLADKIRTLWNNPDLCRELGENASENLCTRYSSEIVARRWQDLLDDIVKES